ncbi:MAG TPA: CCC motif membrane protein [Lacibacter sp.]|nr:CCC motif membrane protein [Lacibacter sp.]
MEQNQQDYLSQNPLQVQPPLPNATAVLVLGILSIVICFITGIIALVLAKKDMALYNANPGAYSAASLSNIKTGRICAIIGIVLQCIGILIYIVMIVFFFAAVGASGGFN